MQLALRTSRTVVQAIFDAAGLTLDPRVTIQERNPQRQVPSFVRRARISRADAMWTLHLDGKIVAAIIFEVQTVKSVGKMLDWALQTATAQWSSRLKRSFLSTFSTQMCGIGIVQRRSRRSSQYGWKRGTSS